MAGFHILMGIISEIEDIIMSHAILQLENLITILSRSNTVDADVITLDAVYICAFWLVNIFDD